MKKDNPNYVRGGNWYSAADGVRSALRYRSSPALRYSNLGFRPARVTNEKQ